MIDPSSHIFNMSQDLEKCFHILERSLISFIFNVWFFDKFILRFFEATSDNFYRVVRRAHCQHVRAWMEGNWCDWCFTKLLLHCDSPALRFYIVEPQSKGPTRSSKSEFLWTRGPFRAKNGELDIQANQHFFPCRVSTSFVDKSATIMASRDDLIVPRPVYFRNRLRLFMHFLNKFPGIHIWDVLHLKNMELQIFFSRQAAELPRVRERNRS